MTSLILLIVATFLCTLVAGFVLTFAIVVMPGIRTLGDGDFLRAFQVMDRVIQKGQPVFMLVWLGSAVALIAANAVGFAGMDATGRTLVTTATVVYLLGVQLLTVVINIPLNNKVQTLDIPSMDTDALSEARREFEARWNAANLTRTLLSSVVALLLMTQLHRS
ncbi:MAG: DUF1772 domain-containing protein [Planctomycetota bacterium]